MILKIYKDDDLVEELQLKQGDVYTLGRQKDCDVILEKLPGISRQHFQMEEEAPGVWKVLVLSKIKKLNFKGQEQKNFNLTEDGEFFLKPYRFVYTTNSSRESDLSEVQASESKDKDPNKLLNDQDFSGENSQSGLENFEGDDKKTIVQNFNGVPYIKIIGQDRKKSEYFRLEGNLWVVGSDEDASVYINEASAEKSHFEISKTETGFFILDCGTTHGTYLNGQKLESGKSTRLFSGDIINVGNTSLQFELRDKSFRKKVQDIPESLYKNPLVFFDQEIAMVSTDESVEGPGDVRQIPVPPPQRQKTQTKKGKKTIMVLVALLAVGIPLGLEYFEETSIRKKDPTQLGPLANLSPVERKIVKQTHKLAKKLYLSGNFELSLVQLEKLHSIIPTYKDSNEIEEYCINARELKYQQAMIEKQRREQEEMVKQVNSIVSQCTQNFKNSYDLDGANGCLAPASSLDPSHPGISQLISEITARIEEKRLTEEMAKKEADKIRRGNELYEKARIFHKKNDYVNAIEAYENHIHSGLPDPKRLVKKSIRYLASIEKMISEKKTFFMDQAESMHKKKQIKEAIELARKAEKVDPYDPQISTFIFKIEKELNTNMKNIYMDSLIEERFGNLETSRSKWEIIIKFDSEDGEYYKKAKRKLKQYGYKP